MRFITSIFVLITAVGVTRAQITISTENLDIPDYAAKIKKIVDEQIVNYRTVVEFKEWDWSNPELMKLASISRWVGIHGQNCWVSCCAQLSPVADAKDRYVHIVSPDDCYFLNIIPGNSKYSIFKHDTEWSNPQSYSSSVHWCLETKQLFRPQQVKEVLETTEDEYEGKPTIRITLMTKYGAKQTTHLDRNTYQHRYSETDKIRQYKTYVPTYIDGKHIEKTEYRSEGGRLWPTRHEDYIIKPDGKRYPLREFTFLEYTAYTPTADELDIEKQFGVKPIPIGPRPDPATLSPKEAPPRPAKPSLLSGDHTRLYSIGCLVFVAVVVAVLYRYC